MKLSRFRWLRTASDRSASASKGTPLRSVLAVLFTLQIVVIVGLVGYFSFKNGQQAVECLANRLVDKAGDRIEDRLSTYFAIP